MIDEMYECLDCPKSDWLKSICSKRDFPYQHARLKHKDIYCNCGEKIRLARSVAGREFRKNKKALKEIARSFLEELK